MKKTAMNLSVWYCVAVTLLALVKAQLDDNDSFSFYEKSESSSPTPLPSESSSLQEEAKEVVLYLTSDQVKVLKKAGAVVNPLPELEKDISEQQYQLSADERTVPQYQPTEDFDQSKKQADFYKESYAQQNKEDLEIQSQLEEQRTANDPSNYKYISKPRQEEYSTLYAPKKIGKSKTYSADYVRYLPNYEVEDLKMERYNTQPLPGYRFENVKVNTKAQTYVQTRTEAPVLRQPEEIQSSDEFRQAVEDLTRALSRVESEQIQQSEEQPEQTPFTKKDKGPVTFEVKPLEPAKVWEPSPVREYTKLWKANKGIENLQKLSPTTPTQAPTQRQFSSLLAPLIQHKKITESADELKDDLINSERFIRYKLQQLQESVDHDQEKYTAEIDRLNKNLVKQNALAEKLALEAASKKPRLLSVKPEVSSKRRNPVQLERLVGISKPIPVFVQTPEPVSFRLPESQDNFRPVPIPSKQSENMKVNKPAAPKFQKPIPTPETSHYIIKEDKLYLRKGLPTENKPELPSSLSIIRHLWDH